MTEETIKECPKCGKHTFKGNLQDLEIKTPQLLDWNCSNCLYNFWVIV